MEVLAQWKENNYYIEYSQYKTVYKVVNTSKFSYYN